MTQNVNPVNPDDENDDEDDHEDDDYELSAPTPTQSPATPTQSPATPTQFPALQPLAVEKMKMLDLQIELKKFIAREKFSQIESSMFDIDPPQW